MLKSTYGTGCFALLNTGSDLVRSRNRLLTTVAYRIDGKTTYALEGAIFVAGASVQWLRDKLGLFEKSSDSGALAAKADPTQNVYLVPAFVGLGAPWWDPAARASLTGMTRNTGAPELARAALESIGYQTRDLIDAMRKDWSGARDTVLRVDGGMVSSDFAMQFLADILDSPVDRPTILETTALGAAWLAGWKAGVWPDMAGFSARWALERQFNAEMDGATRKRKLAGWRDAVKRTLSAN
jgi:glycerol kinase